MRTKVSRRLVIDASVAGSAGGEEATHPTSKQCRDFLKVVLSMSYWVVMTPDITAEWKKHQSIFARQWRLSMVARRKVYHINPAIDEALRSKIERTAIRESDLEVMRKDFRLIEAALATDKIVISLDEVVRTLFATAAGSVGEIRRVVWINPDRTEEQPLPWLEKGAKPEKNRTLGASVDGL